MDLQSLQFCFLTRTEKRVKMFLQLNDTNQNPPLTWRLDVNAVCPKCGQVAILGNATDGGSKIRCDSCGYSKSFGDSAEAVATHLIKTASVIA
jgi:predicted RNA-binding Zn-ribbon protein involved in translation (DUF1610 family)